MTWSNLFLAESKFKITLKTSKIQAWFTFVELLLLGFSLCYAFYLSLNAFTEFSYIPFLIFSFLYACYLYKKIVAGIAINTLKKFEISDEGNCVFSVDEQYTITNKSRISWYACELNLFTSKNELQNKFRKNKQLIIYQDACSKEDYARVCRIIKKTQKTD